MAKTDAARSIQNLSAAMKIMSAAIQGHEDRIVKLEIQWLKQHGTPEQQFDSNLIPLDEIRGGEG